MTRVITPEILRAALGDVHVLPPAPQSLFRLIIDAIEAGRVKVEVAVPARIAGVTAPAS